MSTDDSISEDVSSSGALSHGHASPDGDGGKESETSLVSSEGTSASGLAVSEERHTTSQPAGGPVESRPMDITPACNTIRCSSCRHVSDWSSLCRGSAVDPSSVRGPYTCPPPCVLNSILRISIYVAWKTIVVISWLCLNSTDNV